jgi:hypothetical protein
VNRLSASAGYARVRLAIGAVFVVLGIAIVYRTIAIAGMRWEDSPSFILSTALVVLGVIRMQQSLAILRAPRP